MSIKYFIKKIFYNVALNFCNLERHVILASYPKTGCTYVHYLINNLITNESRRYHHFFSSFIESPDLDMLPIYKVNPLLNSYTEKPLLIKTHNEYHKSFQRVICLTREPVSTLVSYYNYKVSYHNKSFKNFKSFLLNTDAIIQYKNFYKSFLNSRISSRIVFLDYEDAKNNSQVIKDIIKLIYGLDLDLDIIDKVRENCSKQKAKELELLNSKYDMRVNIRGIKFINNKKYLKNPIQNDVDYINSKLRRIYNQVNCF